MKEFFSKKQNIIFICTVVVLLFIGIIIGVRMNGRNTEVPVTEAPAGEKITLLALGVDKQVAMSERHPETNSIGQADAIFLISIDTGTKEVNIAAIPRDTIVTIEKYNHRLQYMGMEEAQICLQYAYADGMVRSCELTRDRVEELFPDTTIDGYISINVQAIMDINDAVGGVEVTFQDEYTAQHLGIPVGSTVNLQGETAMMYLRLRDKEVTGSAYTRMDRIKDYIKAFIPQGLDAVKKNPAIIADMFQTLEQHMVTDVEVADVVDIAMALIDMNIDMEHIHFHTLEGEILIGEDGYEEFYPNETQLEALRKIF